VRKHGQLSPLNIDFEEINIVDVGNIIQPSGLYPRLTYHASIVLEKTEDLEGGRTGYKCARPTGMSTKVECMLLAIAYRIGKVSFVGALPLVQFRKG
jgi:hypothetical protein